MIASGFTLVPKMARSAGNAADGAVLREENRVLVRVLFHLDHRNIDGNAYPQIHHCGLLGDLLSRRRLITLAASSGRGSSAETGMRISPVRAGFIRPPLGA